MGRSSLVPLIVEIVLIDIGVQGMHITNQSEIYRLQPDARSRITSAYMTAYYIGGGIGSAASAALYDSIGWLGMAVCGGKNGCFSPDSHELDLSCSKMKIILVPRGVRYIPNKVTYMNWLIHQGGYDARQKTACSHRRSRVWWA